MAHDTIPAPARHWYDSAHASLCLLGAYLRQTGFFVPLEERVQIQQKTIKYSSVQKLEMLFVALLGFGQSRLADQPDRARRSGVMERLRIAGLCRASRDCPYAGCGHRG
jgi:hypothetical protein